MAQLLAALAPWIADTVAEALLYGPPPHAAADGDGGGGADGRLGQVLQVLSRPGSNGNTADAPLVVELSDTQHTIVVAVDGDNRNGCRKGAGDASTLFVGAGAMVCVQGFRLATLADLPRQERYGPHASDRLCLRSARLEAVSDTAAGHVGDPVAAMDAVPVQRAIAHVAATAAAAEAKRGGARPYTTLQQYLHWQRPMGDIHGAVRTSLCQYEQEPHVDFRRLPYMTMYEAALRQLHRQQQQLQWREAPLTSPAPAPPTERGGGGTDRQLPRDSSKSASPPSVRRIPAPTGSLRLPNDASADSDTTAAAAAAVESTLETQLDAQLFRLHRAPLSQRRVPLNDVPHAAHAASEHRQPQQPLYQLLDSDSDDASIATNDLQKEESAEQQLGSQQLDSMLEEFSRPAKKKRPNAAVDRPYPRPDPGESPQEELLPETQPPEPSQAVKLGIAPQPRPEPQKPVIRQHRGKQLKRLSLQYERQHSHEEEQAADPESLSNSDDESNSDDKNQGMGISKMLLMDSPPSPAPASGATMQPRRHRKVLRRPTGFDTTATNRQDDDHPMPRSTRDSESPPTPPVQQQESLARGQQSSTTSSVAPQRTIHRWRSLVGTASATAGEQNRNDRESTNARAPPRRSIGSWIRHRRA